MLWIHMHLLNLNYVHQFECIFNACVEQKVLTIRYCSLVHIIQINLNLLQRLSLLCLYKQNNEVGIPYWYENSVLSSRRFSIPILNVCIQKSKSRKKWSVCWRGSWKSMQHSTAVQRLIRWQLIGKKLAANCVMLPTSRGQSEKM